MGSAAIAPTRRWERDVKTPTLLPDVGIKARVMSIGNKTSCNYHPARNAENPTELRVALQKRRYLMP